jgi:hypothetical protein
MASECHSVDSTSKRILCAAIARQAPRAINAHELSTLANQMPKPAMAKQVRQAGPSVTFPSSVPLILRPPRTGSRLPSRETRGTLTKPSECVKYENDKSDQSPRPETPEVRAAVAEPPALTLSGSGDESADTHAGAQDDTSADGGSGVQPRQAEARPSARARRRPQVEEEVAEAPGTNSQPGHRGRENLAMPDVS